MSVPRFRLAQLGGGAAQPAFLTLPELGSKAPPFLLSLFRGVVRLALQVVCSDLCTRTKHGPERLGAAGSDPTTFWAAESRKSRVAPAHLSVLSPCRCHLFRLRIRRSFRNLRLGRG